MTINANETSFSVLTASLNQRIPIMAMRAVPTPDQMAYATLTSICLIAKVTAAKLRL